MFRKPKYGIEVSLKHYTEKMDNFFITKIDKVVKTVSLQDFEKMFYDGERKYFKSLPESIKVTTEMVMDRSTRMLYILNRWTE